MSNYYGITYPKILCKNWILKLWKRFMCSRNRHLLDECWSLDDHYLSCDACDLSIGIRYIRGYKNEPND
jgi:hypothetical protein